MKKTAILLALACAFARADYGPGTTDSDLLRSGTPVVTNAWLAVSNDTARLVSRFAGDASRITDGTNTIDAARNVYATSRNWQFTGQRDDDYISLTYGSDAWTMIVYSDSLGTDMSSIVTNENVTRLVFNFPYGERAYSITAVRDVPTYVGRLALTNDIPTAVSADLTPATNYANQVGARVASDATNYTDAVALEFERGTRTAKNADFASNATTANEANFLLNDSGDQSYNATLMITESTNAAIAVADAKISTNNAAFVAAVTNCPVSHQGGGGADWPIGDFGQYGTIGAIIAALVAASTWLKSHLRYELHDVVLTGGAGTLLDRAGNLVVVSGDTTLTLPAAVAGYCRDFLVRLEISGSAVPTITFAAPTGETITYETDGDEFPVPDEAGDWLYSFTESCVAHKFAVSLKKVNVVAQGGS